MRNIVILLISLSISDAQSLISDTKHNLSVSGPTEPGAIKAETETEICIFCHASHNTNGDVPLWNRNANVTEYTLYGSPSMEASSQQPGASSRVCLSCHDGTIALGLVISRPDQIEFPMGKEKIPVSYRSNLSDNLADDHPLNITPHPIDLECASCHDPHNNSFGNFLNINPINGDLCNACHNETNWSSSSHATSGATWNGSGTDPWPYFNYSTVSENACYNCHISHGSASQYWLLKSSAEEDNCLVCHNGNVANTNIQNELLKPSLHSIADYSDIHSPGEDPDVMAEHVECSDCHHPHQVNSSTATAPNITGPLTGAEGVDKNDVSVTAQYEYEVCLKCHGNTLASVQVYVPRYDVQNSIRLEFDETNPSYHPVYAPGANDNVQSLLSPYTTNSIIYCTDCHNNDDAESAGGINGPHGSNYSPILIEQQIFSDYNNESSTIYALCYKCHDRSTVLQDRARFKHWKHVTRYDAACTTCHDSHGSYNNTHLINFNTDYVTPSSSGRLEFIDNGINTGACYLTCHGRNHNPKSY